MNGRAIRTLMGFGAAAACSLALAGPAEALTFTVNELGDGSDQALDGTCDAVGAELCTLRAALEEGGDNAGADAINVDVPGTINLVGGALFISGPDTLSGNAGGTVIDAGGSSHVLGAGGTLATINDLVIQGGASTTDGAGIRSTADTLTLNGVTVTGNSVDSSLGGVGGGGISTSSSSTALVLNDSTVSDNDVTGISGQGGGIKAKGPVTINRSTISGNAATLDAGGSGGGVHLNSGAAVLLSLSNSTVSGNDSGGGGGGGVFVTGSDGLSVTASTIAGNTTTGDGGGIRRSGAGATTSENSIYAANTAGAAGPNCSTIVAGTPESNIDTGTSCGFGTSNGNQQSVSVGALDLGPLADNGGPTETRLIGAASPALDAAGDCAGLTEDQRGISRPQPLGDPCDIGAVELREFTLTAATAGTGSGTVTATGISCPGDCSEVAPEGAEIALTPAPAAGSSFAGWSGACTGSGACVVTLGGDEAVTASFSLNPPPPPQAKKCKKGKKLKKGKCVKKKRKRKKKK